MKAALLLIGVLPLGAETLHYSLKWPSGLNLGQASLVSVTPGNGKPRRLEATFTANIPGFILKDRYSASATEALCSLTLTKELEHGSKKIKETEMFDQAAGTVKRETVVAGGGSTTLSVQGCAKDALTFLEFVRHELAQGKIAPAQQVLFGSPYQVRLESLGTQSIRLGEVRLDADHMRVSLKGPASDYTFEVFFAKDASRTPVFARLPLPLGAFTVELIP
jgi:hypothetical protein